MTRVSPLNRPPETADGAPDIEVLRATIRGVGLRCTTSRITVLDRLYRATGPVSHAELADELVPEGLDRATVYRNLIDFTDAGLLTRTDHGDHVWRFELAQGTHSGDDHVHFLCTDCGVVSCVEGLDLRVSDKVGESVGIGSVSDIVIRGRCEACH